MSKRFIDTEIFSKKWFRKLPNAYVKLWLYIHCHCDGVGVVEIDEDIIEFYIGKKIDIKYFIANTNGNIDILDSGKLFIVDFCEFQYGEKILDLETRSAPIKSFQKLLFKHGLFERVKEGLDKGLERVNNIKNTLKEKEKEKEQDKVKVKEKEEPDFVKEIPDIPSKLETIKKFPEHVRWATRYYEYSSKHGGFLKSPNDKEIQHAFEVHKILNGDAELYDKMLEVYFTKEMFCNDKGERHFLGCFKAGLEEIKKNIKQKRKPTEYEIKLEQAAIEAEKIGRAREGK